MSPDIPISSLALLAGLFTGSLGAYFAHRRGRNLYAWFFLGFLFGILGACSIFLMPSRKQQKATVLPKEEPKIPIIQGPKDKFWYYLNPDHQQMGPVSHDALSAMWRQGKISLTTYIWNEELPEWKLLQELLSK